METPGPKTNPKAINTEFIGYILSGLHMEIGRLVFFQSIASGCPNRSLFLALHTPLVALTFLCRLHTKCHIDITVVPISLHFSA